MCFERSRVFGLIHCIPWNLDSPLGFWFVRFAILEIYICPNTLITMLTGRSGCRLIVFAICSRTVRTARPTGACFPMTPPSLLATARCCIETVMSGSEHRTTALPSLMSPFSLDPEIPRFFCLQDVPHDVDVLCRDLSPGLQLIAPLAAVKTDSTAPVARKVAPWAPLQSDRHWRWLLL